MSDSAAAVIGITVLTILFIADIVGNSLVCAIIKRNRDMRWVDVVCTSLNVDSEHTLCNKDENNFLRQNTEYQFFYNVMILPDFANTKMKV